MATHKFTREFFFPQSEDGNLSLGTTKKRLKKPLNVFKKTMIVLN